LRLEKRNAAEALKSELAGIFEGFRGGDGGTFWMKRQNVQSMVHQLDLILQMLSCTAFVLIFVDSTAIKQLAGVRQRPSATGNY
jgi:hypothetical protein